jgi:hypothetical protein
MNIEIKNKQIFIGAEEFPMPWDMIYLQAFFGDYSREIAFEEYSIYIWDSLGIYAQGTEKQIESLSFLIKKEVEDDSKPENTFEGTFLLNGKPISSELPKVGSFKKRTKTYSYEKEGLNIAGNYIDNFLQLITISHQKLTKKKVTIIKKTKKKTDYQEIFTDLNFKLAIIHSLREIEVLPPFDKDAFWQETFGEPYDDFAEYAYENVSEIIDYYRNFELNPKQLEQIQSVSWLEFDIISDINSQWDGEDNFFEIQSIEGIEYCRNIEKLSLQLGLEPLPWEVKKWGLKKTYVNLQPLKELKKLQELALEGYLQNISSILEIPSLKKIKINSCKILEVEEKKLDLKNFLELVKKKGIKISK